MQQQVVMPQNLNMAQFGQIHHQINPSDPSFLVLPQQQSQDSSSFAIQQFLPMQGQPDMTTPSSAPLHSQAFSFDGSSTSDDAAAESRKVITLETLKSMLPEDTDKRPHSGLLPDGQAYAPGPPQKRGDDDTKSHYLLFSSKAAYISYYINYYFSEANLQRDTYILNLMVDGHSLPISELVAFPRLVAVNTTLQDVENAVANNKLLEIVRPSPDQPCVKRIDGIPAALNRSDAMSAPPTVTIASESFSPAQSSMIPSQKSSFDASTFGSNQYNTQPIPTSTVTPSIQPTTAAHVMWPQSTIMPSYNQPVLFTASQAPETQVPPPATTPNGQLTWSSQAQVTAAATSPRAPGLPGTTQIISPQASQFLGPQGQPVPQMTHQQYNNVLLAMNSLQLSGAGQPHQLRYFAQPPSSAGPITGVNASSGQPDFYQPGTAPPGPAQVPMPQHPSVFFLNPQSVLLAQQNSSFTALGHQGQATGGFSTNVQAPGVPQQQVLTPGHHTGFMAPPGMVSIQQQQAALAALQQQHLLAMQQGFVAAANPTLNQYNAGLAAGNHHQLLQQANANSMLSGPSSNTGGPPPGLPQSNQWTGLTNSGNQSQVFSPPPSAQTQPTPQNPMGTVTPVMQSGVTSSPPGIGPAKQTPVEASESGTPIPQSADNASQQGQTCVNPSAQVPPLNSSSGRSSSSGIASGVSSQNSSSVVAVSSGSSSSVSSSSTASGLEHASNKHPYSSVVAKTGLKPEEVSVAKLGVTGNPGGPPGQLYHHSHRGGKPNYHRSKMNNGNYEENNNHGSFVPGAPWRGGGYHRNGPTMRGGRGGSYNNHYNQGSGNAGYMHHHQGSYNQVAANSGQGLSRTTSNDIGSTQGAPNMPGKRGDGPSNSSSGSQSKVEVAGSGMPQPLAQEG